MLEALQQRANFLLALGVGHAGERAPISTVTARWRHTSRLYALALTRGATRAAISRGEVRAARRLCRPAREAAKRRRSGARAPVGAAKVEARGAGGRTSGGARHGRHLLAPRGEQAPPREGDCRRRGPASGLARGRSTIRTQEGRGEQATPARRRRVGSLAYACMHGSYWHARLPRAFASKSSPLASTSLSRPLGMADRRIVAFDQRRRRAS